MAATATTTTIPIMTTRIMSTMIMTIRGTIMKPTAMPGTITPGMPGTVTALAMCTVRRTRHASSSPPA